MNEEIKFSVFKVLRVSEPAQTRATAENPSQNYITVELLEENMDPDLAKFKNLITTARPKKVAVFEDQGSTYLSLLEYRNWSDEKKESEEMHIKGAFVSDTTSPYYVMREDGTPMKYTKEGPFKGMQVIATSVTTFVFPDQDADKLLNRAKMNNANNLVKIPQLAVYIERGLPGLKKVVSELGIDVEKNIQQSNADADILTGNDTPAQPASPAGTAPTP